MCVWEGGGLRIVECCEYIFKSSVCVCGGGGGGGAGVFTLRLLLVEDISPLCVSPRPLPVSQYSMSFG